MADAKLVIQIEDESPVPPPWVPAGTPAPAPAPPPPSMHPAGSFPTLGQVGGAKPAEPARPRNEFDTLASNPDAGVAAYGAARAEGGDRSAGLAALVASWEAQKKSSPAGTMPKPSPSAAGAMPTMPAAGSTTASKPTSAAGAAATGASSAAGSATGSTAPAKSSPAGSTVPVFDRPVPVTIVGPAPLPVMMAAGSLPTGGPTGGPGGARQPTNSKPSTAGRAEWLGRQAGQAGYVGTRIGDVAEGAAGNSAAPAIGAAVEVAAAGLSKLGPYGMAAGVALQAVAKVGGAASEAVQAFVNRGRELSSYNGQLAGASATADLRSMLSDMREADDMGPRLSRMIDNQSKFETSVSETLRGVKEFFADILDRLMEFANGHFADLLEALNAILSAVSFGMAKSDAIEKAVSRIRSIMADRDLGGDPLAIWREAADRLPAIPAAPIPAAGLLGIPLLMRKKEA